MKWLWLHYFVYLGIVIQENGSKQGCTHQYQVLWKKQWCHVANYNGVTLPKLGHHMIENIRSTKLQGFTSIYQWYLHTGVYRIHSASRALAVSKTWSWYIMMCSKSDLKIIIREQSDSKYKDSLSSIYAFFIEKSSISPIFVCQELDDGGGGRRLIRPWAPIWINMVNVCMYCR